MREILFRGKSTNTDEWIKGSLVMAGKNVMIYPDNGYNLRFVIPETVGQYTGLKDKNGVRIFEGDILQPFDDEEIVVKWIDFYSTLGLKIYVRRKEMKRGKECVLEYCGWGMLNDYDLPRLEVIGNIHDNPELLEGV